MCRAADNGKGSLANLKSNLKIFHCERLLFWLQAFFLNVDAKFGDAGFVAKLVGTARRDGSWNIETFDDSWWRFYWNALLLFSIDFLWLLYATLASGGGFSCCSRGVVRFDTLFLGKRLSLCFKILALVLSFCSFRLGSDDRLSSFAFGFNAGSLVGFGTARSHDYWRQSLFNLHLFRVWLLFEVWRLLTLALLLDIRLSLGHLARFWDNPFIDALGFVGRRDTSSQGLFFY